MRPKPLVLLVDDEEIFLEIASVKLRTEGMETVTTQDVRDAVAKAESLSPDLVLSDVYMPPGPSGWELAIELRRNPKTHGIRIAFFTSLRDPWAELRANLRKTAAELIGPVAVLSKMDDVEVLAQKVSGLLVARPSAAH